MAGYTADRGKDFWFDFDNQTLWQRTPAVSDAMQRAYGALHLSPDTFADKFVESWKSNSHPGRFRIAITAGAQGIRDLADIQLAIIDTHWNDEADVQLAFEDFGQGVLADPRPPRPADNTIHMMDGSPDNWVGYRRWFAFVRGAEVLGHKLPRCARLKRLIALAWAIQTEADPSQASPANPALSAARLQTLRTTWLSASDGLLDWAVATHRFRAPSPQEMQAGGRFAAVRQTLETAATDGNPGHGGKGRFWNLPLATLLQTKVLGHQVIAPPGPNRSANSALIKVLKGTLPGIPRMPLDRPPLSDAQIADIAAWIDADCPEF